MYIALAIICLAINDLWPAIGTEPNVATIVLAIVAIVLAVIVLLEARGYRRGPVA